MTGYAQEMIADTKRAIDRYNQLDNLVAKVFPSTKLNTFLYNRHECPKCKKVVTDLTEYNFLKEADMCLGCDHIQGEVDSMMVLEAQDQLGAMAEANGMSVEDYMEHL
jgi:hypothetical protein